MKGKSWTKDPVVVEQSTDPTELWERYVATRSVELRNQLVVLYLPKVRIVAKILVRQVPKEVLLSDMISAGTIGLMRAVASFDPGRGVRFTTYSYLRIRGSIIDELRHLDWVPRRVRAGPDEPVRTLQLDPTKDEAAAEIVELIDTVPCQRTLSPDQEPCLRDSVRRLVDGLKPRKREIVELSYLCGLSLCEIGARLGISESRVCQLRKEALARLRVISGAA